MTVGELVIRIAADTDALRRDLAEARAEISAFGDSVGGSTSEVNKANRSWLSWSSALRYGIPILAGAGLAALQLTGNMGALAPILPVLTVALGAFLAPLMSLAAVIVLLVGPLSVLIGLLGGLGAAFGFTFMKEAGDKTSYLYAKVQQLSSMLSHLAGTLAQVFRPQFMFLIDSAEQAIKYFDQLAHMPLGEAFKSLANTGIPAVQKFLEQVGHMLANPIRLAVQLAFGTGGNSANSALGSLFDQVRHFFASSQGGKPSIDATIGAWFGARDFTAIGMRWGMALASAVFSAFGIAFQHLIQTRGGKMILGGAGAGAAIGLALGGPIGAALGTAIGAAAGITLNHYWPRITASAKHVWSSVRTFAVTEFHAMTTALEHFLGPATWANLGAIARSTWTMIRTVAVGAFRAAIAVGRAVWQVFDTLIIKTGAWKVALALVKAAIYIVAAVLRPIIAIISRIVSTAVHLGGVFNGAVLSAVETVANVVRAIASAISAAVGAARSLASAVSSIHLPSLPSLQSLHIPGTATGGFRAPGQASIVGERGPELFIPSGAGNIIPNHRSFPSGGGEVTVVQVQLHNPLILGDRKTARDTARWLEPELGRIIKAAR